MTLALTDGAASSQVRDKVHPAPVPPHPHELSDRGVEFIAGFEGFRAAAYDDAARPTNATIGFGHVLHPGACTAADFGLSWTREHALGVLKSDAAAASEAVRSHVTAHLTQQQFDALVSFTFNCGTSAFAGSTLLRHLNAGNYAAIPGDLAQWVHAGNGVVPGLVTRRHAEGVLFAHGLY